MRSPGSWRPLAEHALRAASLAALTVLAIRLWAGSGASAAARPVTTPSLDSALVAWSAVPPAAASVDATTIPGGRQRDWLVALRRTGTTVEWTTSDSAGGALVVEPGPLAQSPSRITALGIPGHDLELGDELGPIESSRAGRDRVVLWRASPIGLARATFPTSTALGAARDSIVTRPVLVVAQAGWEARFVTTALEEEGWSVSARLAVAPGAVVRQNAPARIDTASLSAVIVLDSSSTLDAREIARFVNDGGGIVASGAGVSHPALRPLMPSRVTTGSAGALGALLGPSPRQGLFARTFRTSAGAVPLERRGDAPVVIGRRVGSGRVTAVGYDDTWRLRMAPPDERAPEAHRTWWSSLVAGVAMARLEPRDAGPVDEAPFAAAVDALGPPVRHGERPDGAPPWPSNAWLAAFGVASLLAEWLSRRLRGVA